MKNLNSYGEKFINQVIEKGRLEDEQIHRQVDYVSITESNTHFLVNIEVMEHSESKYIYNNIKYIYNSYKKFICNEIVKISKRLSEEAKEELISTFCDDFSNYYQYEEEEISEDEYFSSNDLSKFEMILKLENKILYNRKYFRA